MAVPLTVPGAAQWLNQRTPGIARGSDGAPSFRAAAPRTPLGTIDLSGVWQAEPDPIGSAGGIEGIVAPRYMIDVTRDMPGRDTLLTPTGAAIYQARAANAFRDNPSIRCLPVGVPRLDAYTHPYKIVQTLGLVMVLYEAQTMFRQIFTDGRALPTEAQPAWMGYSSGRWEGDTLVVGTVGFTDKTWLDGSGHPHSESMRLIERFTRRDVGRMDIEVTVDDPRMYNRPITYSQVQRLQVDAELIEYVCTENYQANLPHILPNSGGR